MSRGAVKKIFPRRCPVISTPCRPQKTAPGTASLSECHCPVGPDSVAELADCARSRWKVENNAFKALKDGYHLEHNFGHGKETLASLLAAFNLIAFLMQSASDLVCESWREARAKLAARCRLLDNIEVPGRLRRARRLGRRDADNHHRRAAGTASVAGTGGPALSAETQQKSARKRSRK